MEMRSRPYLGVALFLLYLAAAPASPGWTSIT
jgi:hypothetical protein